MKFNIIVTILILHIIFSNTLGSAFSDELKYDYVLSDIRISWDKLKSEYQKGVDIMIEYHVVSEKETKQEIRVCFDSFFELNHFFSKGDFLQAINKKYAFNIRRDVNLSNWTIRDFFDNPVMPRENSPYSNKLLWGTSIVLGGIIVEEAWGLELFNSSGFKLISIEKKKFDGDELVEIQFRSNFVSHRTSKILGGKILLDPGHYWEIREYELDVEALPVKNEKSEFAVVKRVISYQYIDGVPFPQNYDICYRYRDGSVVNHLVFDFTSIKRVNIPQEIFYLRHYGLSEPVNPLEIRLTRMRIAFASLGLLLIVIGLSVKIWARKFKG
ncbi:MAG: hypothetical protein LBC74_15255 [Planctomycetaceae bacterium]|jgi:uncharacterized protein YjbK|nr:hypothetical protein [Planctomycetaceae bacterium]